MRVQATRPGFYGNLRRRVGDVFELARPGLFSPQWMAQVPDETPECRNIVDTSIDRGSETRNPFGPRRRVPTPADADDGPVIFDFDPFE